MARTFRQIINTEKVKVLDVDANVLLDADLISYKPDAIIVRLPDNTEIEIYRSSDISNLYHGYVHGKQYTCQL